MLLDVLPTEVWEVPLVQIDRFMEHINGLPAPAATRFWSIVWFVGSNIFACEKVLLKRSR